MSRKIGTLLLASTIIVSLAQAVDDNTRGSYPENDRVKNQAVKTTQSKNSYQEIHTKEISSFIKANPSAVILDVRSVKYDDGNRIPGAKFLPHDSSDEEIQAVIPSRETIVLVYCTSEECPLSEIMAERLVKMGYKNVVRYVEGLEAWENTGLPVDHATPGKKAVSSKGLHPRSSSNPKSESRQTVSQP